MRWVWGRKTNAVFAVIFTTVTVLYFAKGLVLFGLLGVAMTAISLRDAITGKESLMFEYTKTKGAK